MDFLPPHDPTVAALTKDLNPAQREAVTAPPDHRLVLAGAGSGKTRVLTHRVAWLIAVEGVSPQSVLAVTFTNKAANEMRGRIEQLLRLPVRSMWVGTFHGIAHRMLRLHWKEAGLPQNFQILDADDQIRMVKRVMKALDLPEDKYPPKTLTGWINGRKEEAIRPHHIQDSGDYTQRQYVRVYTAYEEQCRRNGLVDFSELLLRAFELCRDVPLIQQHYRTRFRHVLVDEFQDTNKLQYDWLRVLAGERGVLFAVGDDDQSVYSWRGARVENMLHLQRDFLGTEVIRLEQNYRSTGTILRAANGLIAKNSGRLGKNLWTDGREGEAIQLYAAFNEYDEAEFVANRIREGIEGRRRYSDHALLYRTGAQSRVLEEILIRNRMPYRITGGLRFFERQEIKDALAFLRLLHNRDDDASFERAVGTPPRGVGATTIEKLRLWGREQDISLWAAAKTGGTHIGRSANAVNQFMQLIEAIAAEGRELPLSQLTELVIARTGLRDHYRKEKGEQAEGRLENLDELVSAARGFELLPLAPGDDLPDMDPLSAFLGHAALEAGEQQAGPGEDCVQLMTLHAAKGLEFPVVFLVGVENGLFPNMRSIEEGNLEEERRLCYVGITRAREQLYISYAEVRRVHGVEQIGTPSQFLKEIPAETLQETRPRAHIVRPAFVSRESSHGGYGGYGARGAGSSSYGSGGYTAPSRTVVRDTGVGPGGFTLGQRVTHAKFGEGTILSFDGDGDRARVEVRFKSSGNKWLLLAVANLQGL
ncbi:MAG TPA: DNA helicase II [Solimonas sp.]|nr:DNA helicase II [Solimonas sp.]